MKIQLAGSELIFETNSQIAADYLTALGGRVVVETQDTVAEEQEEAETVEVEEEAPEE